MRNLGMTGQRKVGLDRQSAGTIGRLANSFRQRRAGSAAFARGPQHDSRIDRFGAIADPNGRRAA